MRVKDLIKLTNKNKPELYMVCEVTCLYSNGNIEVLTPAMRSIEVDITNSSYSFDGIVDKD